MTTSQETEDNNLKIGIIDHFATGEGRTVIIMVNYEGEVPPYVDDYFSFAVEWFSASIFDKTELTANEECAILTLQTVSPELINRIKKYNQKAQFSYFQEEYLNLS